MDKDFSLYCQAYSIVFVDDYAFRSLDGFFCYDACRDTIIDTVIGTQKKCLKEGEYVDLIAEDFRNELYTTKNIAYEEWVSRYYPDFTIIYKITWPSDEFKNSRKEALVIRKDEYAFRVLYNTPYIYDGTTLVVYDEERKVLGKLVFVDTGGKF